MSENANRKFEDVFAGMDYAADAFDSDITIRLEAPDGDSAEINRTKDFGFINTHSASSSWSCEVPGTFAHTTLKWLLADVYIYNDGAFIFRGSKMDVSGGGMDGTYTLSGEGIARTLKDAGPDEPITVRNERGATALDGYISDETPFAAEVTEPPVTVVDRDREITRLRSTGDFNEVIPEPNATDPYRVTFGGLELLQTNFLLSGHQPDDNGMGMARVDDDEFAEGRAMRFREEGDYAEYEFSPAYNMPRPTVRIRSRGTRGPPLRVLLNGEELSSLLRTHPMRWSHGMIQFDETGRARDLSPDSTHTLRIEATDDARDTSEDYVHVDMVSVYDHRFAHWSSGLWPNQTDSNGHLPGPWLYPESYSVESDVIEVDHNVNGARIDSEWTGSDSVGGRQALAISNNDGGDWATRQNSTTLSTTFVDELGYPDRRIYGMGVKLRFRLGRRGNRTDGTPGQGYLSQRVTQVDTHIDTNSVEIIRDMTLDEDHLSNIQAMAEETGFRFTLPHRENRRFIDVFQTGAVERDVAWRTRDWERSHSPGEYANRVIIRGLQRDEETGEIVRRFRVTKSDDGEIDAVGLVEHRPPVNPDLTTRDMCIQKAREELDARLSEPDVEGSVEIDPQLLTPGYAYRVPEFGDTYHSLEQIDFSQAAGDYEMTLDFEGLGSGIAGSIVGLASDSRKLYRSL